MVYAGCFRKVLLRRHRVGSGALARAPQLRHSEAPAAARPSAAAARPLAAAVAAGPHSGAPPRQVFRSRASRRRAGDAGAAENEHPGTRPLRGSSGAAGRSCAPAPQNIAALCGACTVGVWHSERRHPPTLVRRCVCSIPCAVYDHVSFHHTHTPINTHTYTHWHIHTHVWFDLDGLPEGEVYANTHIHTHKHT